MPLIRTVPWISSEPGTRIFAYPVSRPFSEYISSGRRVELQEVNPGVWQVELDNSDDRFWLLFDLVDDVPVSGLQALATIDLNVYVQPLPEGLTVAVPSVLENAGFDPTYIVRHRGTRWDILFTDIGMYDDVEEMIFTLRRSSSSKDELSILQISSTRGLIVSNQELIVPESTRKDNAELEMLDPVSGVVRIMVRADETRNYPTGYSLSYDIKYRKNADDDIYMLLTSSKFRIAPDVTRGI